MEELLWQWKVCLWTTSFLVYRLYLLGSQVWSVSANSRFTLLRAKLFSWLRCRFVLSFLCDAHLQPWSLPSRKWDICLFARFCRYWLYEFLYIFSSLLPTSLSSREISTTESSHMTATLLLPLLSKSLLVPSLQSQVHHPFAHCERSSPMSSLELKDPMLKDSIRKKKDGRLGKLHILAVVPCY